MNKAEGRTVNVDVILYIIIFFYPAFTTLYEF